MNKATPLSFTNTTPEQLHLPEQPKQTQEFDHVALKSVYETKKSGVYVQVSSSLPASELEDLQTLDDGFLKKIFKKTKREYEAIAEYRVVCFDCNGEVAFEIAGYAQLNAKDELNTIKSKIKEQLDVFKLYYRVEATITKVAVIGNESLVI